MEYAEIVEKVKAIIVDKLGVEPSEVTETANFTNDLGADEETSTIATVKDACDKVAEKLA